MKKAYLLLFLIAQSVLIFFADNSSLYHRLDKVLLITENNMQNKGNRDKQIEK